MGQAGVAANWQEFMPPWPGAGGWWSAERLRLLEEYTRRAEDCHRRGEWEAAIGLWEEALRRLPDMPAPRRLQIEQRLRDTLEHAAREVLTRHDGPGLAAGRTAARRHLEHAARVVPDAAILYPLGLMRHLDGEPGAALECYDAAARAGAGLLGGPALDYATRLARLQQRAASRSAAPNAQGEEGISRAATAPTPPGWRHDPLAETAWRRLGALTALASGEDREALTRFPHAASAVLPAAWALEGALLAALNGDWSACLDYYRRAQAEGTHLARDPHLYVFAAAWLAAGDGLDEPPFPASALREQPPKHLFVDDAQYRAWRRQFLRGQYRWWLARAEDAAGRAEAAEVQRCLTAAIRLLPKARLSRALEAWLACAFGGMRPPAAPAGSSIGALGGWAPDAGGIAALRLSVWVSERFGTAAQAVGELNRLLERVPDDPWGLERWKRWMMRLGREAMAQGRLRQALMQFVSLLLRCPDDADAWRGCARVHAELGNADRAADCLAEAERLERLAARQSRLRGWFGANADQAAAQAGGEGSGEPEYGLLVELIRTLGAEEVAAPPIALSCTALRQAVWASVWENDPYLESLLKEWARSPGSAASAG
ncbi:MAG: hypothetical protein BAA04_13525 [Firmicutes bacterium ZCTH02-B6]|nr:MAG: hypothetical protein BAA04_13525 [Firmicutes bacterium ZCTH02-B6]